MEANKTFYSVRIDKKSWTNEKEVTVRQLEEQGFVVKESRIDADYDVFSSDGGRKVATLFSSKSKAAEYVVGSSDAFSKDSHSLNADQAVKNQVNTEIRRLLPAEQYIALVTTAAINRENESDLER